MEEIDPQQARTNGALSALFDLAQRAKDAQDLPFRISLLEEILRKEQLIESWPPEYSREAFVGEIEFDLGLAYRYRNDGHAGDNLARAANALEQCIAILPLKDSRNTWVHARLLLGDVLLLRKTEERARHLKRAVSVADEALSVVSKDEDGDDWQRAHLIRSFAGFELLQVHENREEIREAVIESYEACASVVTQDDKNWAYFNTSLAKVYLDRIRGSREDNLDRVVQCCGKAIAVLSFEKDRDEWKEAHLLRANAGRQLLKLSRKRHDVRKSVIESYDAIIGVMTARDQDWAAFNINLAAEYLARQAGEPQPDLEHVMMHCKRALEVLSPETNLHNWVAAKVNFALAASKQVDPSNSLMNLAIEAAREATNLLNGTEEPSVFAIAHATLARVLTSGPGTKNAAEWKEAMTSFDKALQVHKDKDDLERYALLQADLGAALFEHRSIARSNEIDRAVHSLEEANSLLTKEHDRDKVIRVKEALGIAYLERRHTVDAQERAIQTFESALSLLTERSDQEAWGVLQMHLSDVLSERMLGDPVANLRCALEKAEGALHALEESNSSRLVASAKINLAAVLSKVDYGVNPEAVDRAVAILESVRAALTAADGDSWVRANYTLAGLYLDREDNQPDHLEAALRYCDEALEGLDKVRMPWAWIDLQINRSAALYRQVSGDPARNRVLAISALQEVVDIIAPEADPRRHLIAARRLGLLLAEEKKFEQAYLAFGSALAAAELLLSSSREIQDKFHSLYQAREVWSDAAYCAYRMNQLWTALELVERGRARLLRDFYRFDRAAAQDADQESRDRLREAIQESQLQLQASDGVQRLKCLDHLRELHEQMAREVGKGVGDIFAGRPGIRELLRDVTADGTTIVIPVLSRIGVITFVARAGFSDIEIEVVQFPQQTYDNLQDLLGKNVSGTSVAGFLAEAVAFGAQQIGEQQWSSVLQDASGRFSALLFDRIVEVLEKLKLQNGAPIALLSGRLSVLPVGMMRGGQTRKMFIDRFELRVAPSISALAIARDRSATEIQSPRRLAALVDTKGDLPFARLEGNLVSSWFGHEKGDNVIDNRLTKEAIMALLNESSHWHFACHGSFDWFQPAMAGLQLARGKVLTVEDFFNRIEGRPRLVVLSACETGLQDTAHVPYEAFGLIGAMFHAGAAATIGTLWRVNDLSAALVCAQFYECLIGRRMLPATALREAQLWIRDSNCRSLIDYLTTQELLGRIPAELAVSAKTDLRQAFAESQKPYVDPWHWAGWIIMGT